VLTVAGGLDKLNGFSFVSAAAVFPPLADGTNLKGVVILPNPTVVTFEMVCNPPPIVLEDMTILTTCREM
jgi:hypothetical protein